MSQFVLLATVIAVGGCLTGGGLEFWRPGVDCQVDRVLNVFITSEEGWNSVCSGAHEVAGRVSFTTSTIVLASWGGPSSGYSATIDAVVVREGAVEVFVTRTSPGESCAVLPAYSAGSDVVVVDRPNLHGTFTAINRLRDCSR